MRASTALLFAFALVGARVARADDAAPTPAAPPADPQAAAGPTPAPAPAPAAPTSAPPAPSAASPHDAEGPVDDFMKTGDDPRVPSFLRALRLGEDSLLLGAYLQPGFRYVVDTDFNDDDSDGFDFAAADIIGRGERVIWRELGAALRFDLSVAQGSFNVRDLYGTVFWAKDLVALDVGQLKVPFGLATLQSDAMLANPVPSRLKRLGWGRDVGVQLRSDIPAGPAIIGLSAMAANGDGGIRQRINIDNKFLFAGRLEVSPLGRMARSEPDLEGSTFQLAIGGGASFNQALGNEFGIADAGASELRVGGDVRFWWKGLSGRAEYARAFRGEDETRPAYQRYGVMGELGYVLPIPIDFPKFELIARIEQLDLDTDRDGTEGEDYVVDQTERRDLQFGLSAYVAKHAVKVHFLYQLSDLLEGPRVDANGDVLLGDTVFVFTQFAWL